MNSIEQKELADARKGTLFFLSNLEIVKVPSFDTGMISNFVSSTSILTDLQNASTHILKTFDTGRQFIDGFNSLIVPIKQLITTYLDAITERMVKLYGEGSEVVEWVAEFATWAASTFAGSLADIVPGWGYVQNAVDIYEAFKRSVLSCINWMNHTYSGWGVDLLEGGPTIMAQALSKHHMTGLAGGLKDVAITSIKTGLSLASAFTAGISTIIGIITGILQRITNMIGYASQRFLLNKTINQARYQYINSKIEQVDHDHFTDWFRKSCSYTPVISALTLCSGFAAHPNRFLSLTKKDGELIDQKTFNEGIDHISTLKELSIDYLKEYQDAYKIEFTSSDKLVSNRLKDVLK